MGRAPCCDKNGLKKGPWTPEEDLKLTQYIQIHGPGNWRSLPKNAGLQRCGKSCRLRWTNYLRPDIKRGRFSFEEEESIIQLHSILGNKWSAIAARLPGRTDNEIKNYWNTHIRKRLLRNGIDPVTHSPRLDLLDLSSIFASSQLNLSNFLGLQALLNPDILRLATTLLAPTTNQENQEMVLQSHQENQLPNSSQLLQNLTPMLQPNKSQNPIQEVACASSHDQTQFLQGMNMAQFPSNSANFQKLQDQLATSCLNPGFDNSLQNYGYNISDCNFAYDSVKSTPSSSQTPLTSSSTFINSGTEDERESYCSDLFKFEIPESLDFDDFM